MADEHPRDGAEAPEPDQPPTDATHADDTQPEPTEPEPPRTGAGDETVVAEPPDLGPSGTTVMPAVPPAPPTPPRWSARAQVPQHEPGGGDGGWDEPGQTWEEEEPPPRRALAPILISLLVLVLLAILAFGVWLVIRSQSTGAPAPTESAVPTGTTQTAGTPPPTTSSAPLTPPVTAPVAVAIPDVAGLPFDTAAARLRDLGLDVVRTNRSSTSVPAGNVIGTDPAIGTQVLTSSSIAIVVSSGAPTTRPTTRPPASPTTSPPAGP